MVIHITEAEYQVMNILWKIGHSTSRELSEILEDTMDWKPATTKTLLGRLAKKNLVTTQQENNYFIYRPAVSEKEALSYKVDHIMENICAKSIGQVALHIVQHYDINESDLREIQQALADKKPNNAIACDCIPADLEDSTVSNP